MLIPLVVFVDLLPVIVRRKSFRLTDLGLVVVVLLALLLPATLLPDEPSAERLLLTVARLSIPTAPPLSEWLIAAPEPLAPPRR